MQSIGLQGNVMLQKDKGTIRIWKDVSDESMDIGEFLSSYISTKNKFLAYISIDVIPLNLGLNEYNPDHFKVGGTA